MKKQLFLCLTTLFLLGENPEDLPNLTTEVTIRNLYSGVGISLRDDRFNWIVKDVSIPLEAQDKITKIFKLNYIQLVDSKNQNVCLAITDEKMLRPKTCFEDLTNRQYETVFTIIPTLTTAIQLKALAQGGDLCLGYSEDAPRKRPFKLKPCNFNAKTPVEPRELFLLLPAFVESTVTNP